MVSPAVAKSMAPWMLEYAHPLGQTTSVEAWALPASEMINTAIPATIPSARHILLKLNLYNIIEYTYPFFG